MACNCRDSTGNLLPVCLGMCATLGKVINQYEDQNRIEDKLNNILEVMNNINCIITHEWKKGFQEGILFAIENDMKGNY
jgi:16S rRNA C1402 (ribose-2'-O) methylase RsmI